MLFAVLSLAACRTAPDGIQQHVAEPPPLPTPFHTGHIELTLNDVALAVDLPPHWEFFQTEQGVILAEETVRLIQGRQPEGMIIYLFLPAIEAMPVQMVSGLTAGRNSAWELLDAVAHRPQLVGEAVVTEPLGFEWDGYDAAYYTLNSGTGTLTALFAVALPDQRVLAANVTVPQAQAEKIRAMLPDVLQTVWVNGYTLTGAALDAELPAKLQFPDFEMAIASENTPSGP